MKTPYYIINHHITVYNDSEAIIRPQLHHGVREMLCKVTHNFSFLQEVDVFLRNNKKYILNYNCQLSRVIKVTVTNKTTMSNQQRKREAELYRLYLPRGRKDDSFC